MGHIYLLEGPVGAGKSTLALRLVQEKGAVFFNLDAWFARLFRPDRPEVGLMDWYLPRKARCMAQIYDAAKACVAVGTPVILELGLLRREARLDFYAQMEAEGIGYSVYILEPGREIRRQRVERRNREQGETFSMVVPSAFFEMASDLWESPEADECEGRVVHFF